MQITIDPRVQELLNLIKTKGYQAYLVGGLVRDSLILQNSSFFKIEPNVVNFVKNMVLDVDIATNASPKEIKTIFSKYKLFTIGIKHGTIGILFQGLKADITTYRIDMGYSDNRRPDKVTFVSDLRSDLARRDFTINAMASDENGEIIDHFLGITDLKDHIIRTVGNPEQRIKEDSLRIIRAVRFAARFNFKIEPLTKQAMISKTLQSKLRGVSKERVYLEFNTILKSPNSHIAFQEFTEINIFGLLFDAKVPSNLLKTLIAQLKVSENYNTDVRWVLFYYTFILNQSDNKILVFQIEILSNFVKKYLRGMKRQDVNKIAIILRFLTHDVHLQDSKFNIGIASNLIISFDHFTKALNLLELRSELIETYISTLTCISIEGQTTHISYHQLEERFSALSTFQKKFNELITGDDLKQIGYSGGSVGAALHLLKTMYLSDQSLTMENLLTVSKGWLQDYSIYITSIRESISQGKPIYTMLENSLILKYILFMGIISKQYNTSLTVFLEESSNITQSSNFLQEIEKLKQRYQFELVKSKKF